MLVHSVYSHVTCFPRNKRNGIVPSMDLVNIMNNGNKLYSGLSSLSRQSYLLVTEVPEIIIVLNMNYQLKYSQR